jgi:hypothetical protein
MEVSGQLHALADLPTGASCPPALESSYVLVWGFSLTGYSSGSERPSLECTQLIICSHGTSVVTLTSFLGFCLVVCNYWSSYKKIWERSNTFNWQAKIKTEKQRYSTVADLTAPPNDCRTTASLERKGLVFCTELCNKSYHISQLDYTKPAL